MYRQFNSSIKYCAAFIFIFLAFAVQAQKIDLIPYRINKQWGYSDKEGNIVIPVQYDEAGFFKDGVALVEYNDHYQLIDEKGEVISKDTITTDLFSFPLPARLNGKYGYLNKKGKWVINPQFERVESFGGDLAAVKKEGKYGLINKKGEFVVPPEYKEANFYIDYGVITDTAGKSGVVNAKGDVVLPVEFEAVQIVRGRPYQVKSLDYFIVTKALPEENNIRRQGVYYKDKETIPAKYKSIRLASVDPLLFTFQDDEGYWGVMDEKGNVAIKPMATMGLGGNTSIIFYKGLAGIMTMGTAAVKQSELKKAKTQEEEKELLKKMITTKYINTKGETVFEISDCFMCIPSPFYGETAKAINFMPAQEEELEIKFYNKKGERVPYYIGNYMNGVAPIIDFKKERLGYINEAGDTVVPFKYHLFPEYRSYSGFGVHFSEFDERTGLAKVYVDDVFDQYYKAGYINKEGFEYFKFDTNPYDIRNAETSLETMDLINKQLIQEGFTASQIKTPDVKIAPLQQSDFQSFAPLNLNEAEAEKEAKKIDVHNQILFNETQKHSVRGIQPANQYAVCRYDRFISLKDNPSVNFLFYTNPENEVVKILVDVNENRIGGRSYQSFNFKNDTLIYSQQYGYILHYLPPKHLLQDNIYSDVESYAKIFYFKNNRLIGKSFVKEDERTDDAPVQVTTYTIRDKEKSDTLVNIAYYYKKAAEQIIKEENLSCKTTMQDTCPDFLYTITQVRPQYPGGADAFGEDVLSGLNTDSLEEGTMATIILDCNGLIEEVKFRKFQAPPKALQNAITQAIKNTKSWSPASHRGKRVKFQTCLYFRKLDNQWKAMLIKCN